MDRTCRTARLADEQAVLGTGVVPASVSGTAELATIQCPAGRRRWFLTPSPSARPPMSPLRGSRAEVRTVPWVSPTAINNRRRRCAAMINRIAEPLLQSASCSTTTVSRNASSAHGRSCSRIALPDNHFDGALRKVGFPHSSLKRLALIDGQTIVTEHHVPSRHQLQ